MSSLSSNPLANFTKGSVVYPDDLIIEGVPFATWDVTIASGADLTRGAVLGKVTADGKYKLSASAAGDGSEVPSAILVHDAAASGADVATVAYVRADVNENSSLLNFGTGHTVASTRDGLRDKLILFQKGSRIG